MIYLFTGSRLATPKLIEQAKDKVVDIAIEFMERDGHLAVIPGVMIIVGDADGIDAAVIEECDKWSIPVVVNGANGKVNNRTKTGVNIAHKCGYLGRDRLMAEACDMCFAFWNGVSTGTKYTFDQAMALEKQVVVKIDEGV